MQTMTTLSRRPSRKSEPNLTTNIQPVDAYYSDDADATDKIRRSIMSSPTSPASLYRPRLSRLSLHELLTSSYIKKSNRIRVASFGGVCLVLLWGVKLILMGPRGSIKGGLLGLIWDQCVRDYTRYKTLSRWRKEVRSQLHTRSLLESWYFPFDASIKTFDNYAIVELLLREKRRVEKLGSMIQNASDAVGDCLRDDKRPVHIPSTVLQLLPHNEQPPLPPYWISRSNFDTIAIHNSDINVPLSQEIYSCQNFLARNHATISTDSSDLQCVAYHLGGIQLSDNTFALQKTKYLDMDNVYGGGRDNVYGGGSCKSKVGYAVFSNYPTPEDQPRKTSAISSHVSTILAAFPPKHPAFFCIPPLGHTIGISPYNEANEELSFQSTFTSRLLTEFESRNFNGTSSVWGIATLPCDFEHVGENANCCNQVTVTILGSFSNIEGIANHLKDEHVHQNNNSQSQQHHLIFTFSKFAPSIPENGISQTQSNPVFVEISEVSNNGKTAREQKVSIQMKLRNDRCEPGWFCNRCLKSSIYGSFSKCAFSCSECAARGICNSNDDDSMSNQVKVKVQVTGLHFPTANALMMASTIQHNRIPRIIHQTYFEDITVEKYPQLLRLQNTWKASGWEYRFYTDDTARRYIGANYPSRFVSVFDSLLPGAYKADFFRYLVLYKEGGIYSDVDVMLNTNLDSFVTPDLAFFAPIDAVGTFANDQYCVWNGLIGSAPAHPVLTNVIEWMVNRVSSRSDMYDLERSVCKYSGIDKLESWKVRAEPGLMLSGPCALGLAVNNALGHEPLSKFRPGLLKGHHIQGSDDAVIGNIMILLADKDDLGAFRFSDPDRNILVASTDLAGLSKSPMIYDKGNLRSRNVLVQKKPHYSISTAGQMLWGTHDVYKDDLTANDQVSITVTYE